MLEVAGARARGQGRLDLVGVPEDKELSFLVRVPSVCMFGVGPWARAHLIRAWRIPSPGLLAWPLTGDGPKIV